MGYKFFIEKLPGVASHETRKVAEAAKRQGCRTTVGFNRRFIPVFRDAKAIVKGCSPITNCTAVFHKKRYR